MYLVGEKRVDNLNWEPEEWVNSPNADSATL